MTELLTAAQMRAFEQAAIESGSVTGLELMERAGQGVVEAILEWQPELAETAHRAVVLCGPGNNGGDGFVVARLLKERGWEVEVFLYGEEKKLPPDAAENCRRWRELGEVLDYGEGGGNAYAQMSHCDLVVDALFGTGVSRALEDYALQTVSHEVFDDGLWWTEEEVGPVIVAIDVPSGLCSDSGRHLEALDDSRQCGRATAHLTVTFHSAKVGHFIGSGPALCGALKMVDIGLPRAEDKDDPWGRVDAKTVRRVGSPTERSGTRTRLRKSGIGRSQTHKYTYGHALIFSGSVGKGGAARLAARGALRIGAGLVTVGCPPGALQENAARLDAIMLRSIKDAETLRAILVDARINALCLGPGMGVGARTREMVFAALEGGGSDGGHIAHPTLRRAVVLDADALTSFADAPRELFEALHSNCVLTPHGGEFARLFPDIAERLAAPATKGPAYSKVDACREAAARAGCVVLLKGADTVIASPDARCSINSAHYERASPWLATAGSGDVLAGFITGLLARGFAPHAAAETAAWLHVECARKFGPGLIAEDLPEQLPAVFRDLGI